jgi:uncharacterized metal-binding protein YceD (DUF177 family)
VGENCTFLGQAEYTHWTMRILVTTIPFSGMKVDAPISKDALNARLKEGSTDNGIVFQDEPLADLTLTRTHGGVIVKGIISGTCKQDCSSCGDFVPHEAVAHIDWILQNESDQAAPDDEIDDPGVIFYTGDHVDLEEPLQEALILSLSPFWHPPRDSSERCLLCKRDCSERAWRTGEPPAAEGRAQSSFGNLLKGALKGGKE